MKKSFLLFAAILLLSPLATMAQNALQAFELHVIDGDSIFPDVREVVLQPNTQARLRVQAPAGVSYKARAKTVKYVLSLSMGAGRELPVIKFPADPAQPCEIAIPMPTNAAGPLDYTLVVEGLYKIEGGKRVALPGSLQARSVKIRWARP